MRVLTLAYYDIKRLMRHRHLAIAFLIAPVVMILPRLILARSSIGIILAWACPFACAIFVWAAIQVQCATDRASGFLDGLVACPISDGAIVLSRVLAGACIFAVQMAIFGGLLAARF